MLQPFLIIILKNEPGQYLSKYNKWDIYSFPKFDNGIVQNGQTFNIILREKNRNVESGAEFINISNLAAYKVWSY